MTKFELFCVLSDALESVWLRTGDEQFRKSGFDSNITQNEDLRLFLSDADPSVWIGANSADPARPSTSSLYYYTSGVRKAFSTITREEWREIINRCVDTCAKQDFV